MRILSGLSIAIFLIAAAPRAFAEGEGSPISVPSESVPGPNSPVVTPVPGNWGMSFLFGGLAPLSVAGFNGVKVNNTAFTEIGFRAVTKYVVIPFSFGLGLFDTEPSNGKSTTDFGMSASVGVLKGFRMWRRISPYFGGQIHLAYYDPTGPANWSFTFAFGPVAGIEYFIADRVSLFGQAELMLAFIATDPAVDISINTALAGGGQLGLTFYF